MSIKSNCQKQESHFHHVHASAAEQLLSIEQLCIEKKLRLTSLRKEVLTLILNAEKPLGAYTILSLLKNRTKPAAPPTVYRSLEFLLEHGFIHRLTSINAYIPCCHPREKHEAAFLICESCERVQEFSKQPLFSELNDLVLQNDFLCKSTMIEIKGTCSACRKK